MFLIENKWISIKISLKFVPGGPDNGLAPTGRQAMIWTNDDLVYCRIYASLGPNKFKYQLIQYYIRLSNKTTIKS